MIVANYGGGTNSTAMLVGAAERGLRPDIIVFADTGSEMPHTYQYLDVFGAWLEKVKMPPLSVVRWVRSRPGLHGEKPGDFVPLHVAARRASELPSKAYGYSGCTSKWKQQPIDRFVETHPDVRAAWERGEVVERWIGFDADEPERTDRMIAKNPQPASGRVQWRAPLVEWDWGRLECEEGIRRAGLPSPGKSSCFMCPSLKKREVSVLAAQYPELMEIALDIEDAARPTLQSVKGLGRAFAWRDYLEGEREAAQAVETVESACGCHDG